MAAKLTVILPAYNGMPYLPQAVESILGQSFTDFTFIIVNDGSTDGTGEYLSSLTDPRIEIANQVNAGQGASLNAGLQRCKSEFIAYMDADDNSMPDRLRQQLEFMEANPQIVMLGTQIEFLVGAVVQKSVEGSHRSRRNSCPLAEGTRRRLPSQSDASHGTRVSDRRLSHLGAWFGYRVLPAYV